MRTNELMLYKNMEHGRILKNMTFLMENCGNDYYNREDLRSLLFECMNEILEILPVMDSRGIFGIHI